MVKANRKAKLLYSFLKLNVACSSIFISVSKFFRYIFFINFNIQDLQVEISPKH